MGELLLREKPLSTSDIAYPAHSDYRNGAATYANENTQPEMEAQQTASMSSTALYEGPLFVDSELKDFRRRWDQVQASFVDEPRQAVAQADSLVASVVQRIAEQFAAEREQLEQQWDSGANVSTEDLRQAFKRYRAFFGRLLAF